MNTVGAAHNVRVLGSGETTVVLGHGYGTDQSVWKYLVPHLVDNYKVLLYDNMGAGTTNPDYYDFDRYSTVEGYAHDLLAILEEFNVQKCVHVGHSMSAMVALAASIIHPDFFHKLIILCSTPRVTNTVGYHGGADPKDMEQLIAAMTTNYHSYISGFPSLAIGSDLDSVALQEFSRTLFNMRPDISLSLSRTLSELDMRPLLPRVTVPCHIIQSSKDNFVPVEIGEYLHQNIGGKSVVEVMSTEGHLPHLSAPEVTIPVLLRHIKYDIFGAPHNVKLLGSGDTTVVLGHGYGTDQSAWRYLVPHLVDHYTVLLYDNMGSGSTNPDYFDFDRYSTIQGYAYDLLAILEEFKITKCIYVGHSLSAMVGHTASISRPDLFHKLVMISASPRCVNVDDYIGGFPQEELEQLWVAMESNFQSLVLGMAPLVVGGDMDSEAVQEYSRTLFNTRPDIAKSVVRTVFEFDLRSYLGNVTVPCHIIQSSKDRAVPLSVGEYLHKNLCSAKSIIEVMDAEGHLPHLSAPDVTIPVLLRHIQHDIA